MKEENNNSAGVWIVVVAGVIVLYVLSLGPVDIHYMTSRKDPPRWVEAVYSPLLTIMDHSKTAERIYFNYRQFLGLK